MSERTTLAFKHPLARETFAAIVGEGCGQQIPSAFGHKLQGELLVLCGREELKIAVEELITIGRALLDDGAYAAVEILRCSMQPIVHRLRARRLNKRKAAVRQGHLATKGLAPAAQGCGLRARTIDFKAT